VQTSVKPYFLGNLRAGVKFFDYLKEEESGKGRFKTYGVKE